MKRTLFRIVAVAGVVALYAACNDDTTAPKPGMAPRATPSFEFSVPSNGTGACMGDDAVTANGLVSNWVTGVSTATSLNCTSNDIAVAKATVTEYSLTSASGDFVSLNPGDTITCSTGQTIFAHVIGHLHNNAQNRYNIGIWIPEVGDQSAVTGSCTHYWSSPRERSHGVGWES